LAEPVISPSMNGFEWMMLVLLSFLWGGSFFFNGMTVGSFPPFTLVFLRVALAAVVLYAFLASTGLQLQLRPVVWRSMITMALLNNVIPFSLIVWGQGHLASGLAAILNATTPLWTVVVAHVLTSDEKMTSRRIAAVFIGIVGVTCIIGWNSSTRLSDTSARVAVLIAAISYALAGVYGRRFRGMGLEPLQIATGQVTASALIMLPVVLFIDQPWTYAMPSIRIWVAITGLASLSTALAYVLYFRILSTAGATNLLLVTFLIPVSATLLGSLFLHETFTLHHLVGIAIIGFALALIDGRLFGITHVGGSR
jgi:drug/metabolite transporter (DMT)-like permease